MQKFVWKLVIIVVVLASCVWAAYPPQEKIRLGRDLRGGVSLTYTVSIPEGIGDTTQTINQVIAVLKDRVNPTGVLDIGFSQVGRDRIEVVMPLPSEDVKRLRAELDAELRKLRESAEISPTLLDQALQAGTAVQQYGGSASQRRDLLASLQSVYDELQAARSALAEAQDRSAPQEELMPLEQAVADAEIEFDQRRSLVLATSLDDRRVMAMLEMSQVNQKDADGKEIPDSSPRAEALQRLRADFPNVDFEPVIKAYDAYMAKRTGFDDPSDLIRLLRGAGVLEYYIAAEPGDQNAPYNVADLRTQLQERGPEGTDLQQLAKWFPINDVKQWYQRPTERDALLADPVSYFANTRGLIAAEYNNQIYLLLQTREGKALTHTGDKSWSLKGTRQAMDDLGRPAVGFDLDEAGGAFMSRLTGQNINKPMAIVLDGQVYSAPNIQGQIGNSGIIMGNFSQADLEYLHRVLNAGSLEARLSPEPISINIMGPTLGQENLYKGLEACVLSVIFVAGFMLLYYFGAGIIAILALAANAIFIFGVMAFMDGTFTLPGLAGIALTIGMAVDANVLIYERMREEFMADEDVDLKAAIRLGFSKALSTILDANITNLLICVVLIKTATTEVKGFAVTLTIGIVGTLLTTLFMARVLFELANQGFKMNRLLTLTTTVPAVQRLLHPNINWMGLRKFFFPLSIVAIIISIALVASRGVEIFDLEFRGGVAAVIETAPIDADDDGEPDRDESGQIKQLWLPQIGPGSVQEAIHSIAQGVADPATAVDPDERVRLSVLREFRNAQVVTFGEEIQNDPQHGLMSRQFQVRLANPPGLPEDVNIQPIVEEAIVEALPGKLNIPQPITFDGIDSDENEPYVHPLNKPTLGQSIGRPEITEPVRQFSGGVAIVLNSIDPPATIADLNNRIDRMRKAPDYTGAATRDFAVIGLDIAEGSGTNAKYRSAATMVGDQSASIHQDFDVWKNMADEEWRLTRDAMTHSSGLAQISSFSPSIAQTLGAKAIVAVVLSLIGILVYIWVRFGSLRYSLAAVVALVHDVTIALGLLAFTQIVGSTAIATMLKIEEFHIDLNVVAALLTIIGYSLNDTIVILDRIRENRGKLPLPTPKIVNDSINQAFSRTVLTSGTTLLSALILYVLGGTGIRPFAFCLVAGLIVGTYSSSAIAAPLVLRSQKAAPMPTEPEFPPAS